MSGEAAQPGAVRTILVPLALAPVAEALRAAVVAEARAFGARVVLLHVLPPRVAPTDAGVCQAEAGAHAFLESVAAQMTGAGVRARAPRAPRAKPRKTSSMRSSRRSTTTRRTRSRPDATRETGAMADRT